MIYDIKFPSNKQNLERKDEYFILTRNDRKENLRLHDYAAIYGIPNLYEYLLVNLLQFNSHNVITQLLREEINKSQSSATELNVLELAAGVGLVGELLKNQGIKSLVGIDLVKEAAEAVKRERPNVYDRYYTEELPTVSQEIQTELKNYNFNCLVCASAITGGLPASAFAFAYNLVADGGWIAFNIREDLIDLDTNHSCGKKIARLIKENILEVKQKKKYQHRISVTGKPLYEVALVCTKIKDIPQ